jgi:hypothetical protein
MKGVRHNSQIRMTHGAGIGLIHFFMALLTYIHGRQVAVKIVFTVFDSLMTGNTLYLHFKMEGVRKSH